MQSMLLQDLLPGTSLMPNIYSIFQNSDQFHDDVMACETFTEKLRYVWSLNLVSGTQSLMHPEQLCSYIHLGLPRVAGAPCQDWSSAGNKLGLLGSQLPTLLALGRKSHACADAVTCIENSPICPIGFPNIASHQRSRNGTLT